MKLVTFREPYPQIALSTQERIFYLRSALMDIPTAMHDGMIGARLHAIVEAEYTFHGGEERRTTLRWNVSPYAIDMMLAPSAIQSAVEYRFDDYKNWAPL